MLSTPDQPKPALVRRVEIAQAALDKFSGKPFEWGVSDCARLAANVLQAAGYVPRLSQFGDYRSDLSARRALRDAGFTSVVEWIDSVKGLARISPLGALPGDLIAFPGVGGWDGLAVALGNGRVLAYTERLEGACGVLEANMEMAVAAWSVDPCRS